MSVSFYFCYLLQQFLTDFYEIRFSGICIKFRNNLKDQESREEFDIFCQKKIYKRLKYRALPSCIKLFGYNLLDLYYLLNIWIKFSTQLSERRFFWEWITQPIRRCAFFESSWHVETLVTLFVVPIIQTDPSSKSIDKCFQDNNIVFATSYIRPPMTPLYTSFGY